MTDNESQEMTDNNPCDSETSGKPIPGRCGAPTRGGGYCESYPTEGHERCRMHGGVDNIGRPIIHGRYSRVARGQLKETMLRWEELEDSWRDCHAEISLQQALLERYVSTLPEEPTTKQHNQVRAWTTAITQAKARAAKIEQGGALTAAAAKLFTVTAARELTDLLGKDKAQAFIEHLSESLLGQGVSLLPEGSFQVLEMQPSPLERTTEGQLTGAEVASDTDNL